MAVLGIDCSVAGISGDMTIASLLQLVPNPEESIEFLLSKINEASEIEFNLQLVEISYKGLKGRKLLLRGERLPLSPEKMKQLYEKLCVSCEISGIYKDFGVNVIESLIETEKIVHDSNHVELHELGTFDTLVDAFIPAYLLQQLQVTHVQISPVATGTGTSACKHGVLPVPSPATQILLEKGEFNTIPGTMGELTTPTGAAILLAMSTLFPKSSSCVWTHHTYGYGQKSLKDRGNFVRLRYGVLTEDQTKITLLETNIDDISGEIMGDTVGRLLDAGALDVNFFPIYMKKNRPAYCLRVLCEKSLEDKLAHLTMQFTGTLGIRIMHLNRHVGGRNVISITRYINEFEKELTFRVKKGTREKVEFEDLQSIAELLDLSPLQVEEVLRKYI